LRIAVTSTGKEPESEVDQRFGRAAYFVIVDTETMDCSVFENDSLVAGSGAGISSARAIAGAGVQSVLTGNCGPDAERVLRSAGVRLYTGLTGTVAEVVDLFRKGTLKEAEGPSVEAHFGAGPSRNRRSGLMEQTCTAEQINIGFHPDGYRIDRTALPMKRYTQWQILPGNHWRNPKPVCFDALPREGWFAKDKFDWDEPAASED